jgi:hypothetical protein
MSEITHGFIIGQSIGIRGSRGIYRRGFDVESRIEGSKVAEQTRHSRIDVGLPFAKAVRGAAGS